MKKFLYRLLFLCLSILIGFVGIVLITTNFFSDPAQYLVDVRYCGCTGEEVYEKIKELDPHSTMYLVLLPGGGHSCFGFKEWEKNEFKELTVRCDTVVLGVNVNYFIDNCLRVAWEITFKNGIVVKQESVFGGGEGPPILHCESLYDYHPIVYTLDTQKLNKAIDSEPVRSYTESIDENFGKYVDNMEN